MWHYHIPTFMRQKVFRDKGVQSDNLVLIFFKLVVKYFP